MGGEKLIISFFVLNETFKLLNDDKNAQAKIASSKQVEMTKWEPLEEGFYKVNFYAGYYLKDKRWGVGMVIWDY